MSDSKLIGALDPMAAAELARFQQQSSRLKPLTPHSEGGVSPVTAKQHEQEIKKAATQFESLLVKEMLKSMWSTVPKEGILSGSKEEEIYQDMFQDSLADSISEHQSIGVREIIMKDIKASENRAKKGGPAGGSGAS